MIKQDNLPQVEIKALISPIISNDISVNVAIKTPAMIGSKLR